MKTRRSKQSGKMDVKAGSLDYIHKRSKKNMPIKNLEPSDCIMEEVLRDALRVWERLKDALVSVLPGRGS